MSDFSQYRVYRAWGEYSIESLPGTHMVAFACFPPSSLDRLRCPILEKRRNVTPKPSDLLSAYICTHISVCVYPLAYAYNTLDRAQGYPPALQNPLSRLRSRKWRSRSRRWRGALTGFRVSGVYRIWGYSLNSLKGSCTGDYEGEDYRGYTGGCYELRLQLMY